MGCIVAGGRVGIVADGAGTGATAAEEQCATWLSKYNKMDAVVEALASGDTVLIKGSWLVEFARSSRALPRRQDLPPEAIWDAEELGPLLLQTADGGVWDRFAVMPIALSYCWATKEHPDPTGEQIRRVAGAVKAWTSGVRGARCRDAALFIDWCSLYQEPRSPEEAAAFKRGLQDVNLWYAHKQVISLLLTVVPQGVKAYAERGWPSFEFAISGLAKDSWKVLDLGVGLPDADDVFETYEDVMDKLVNPCRAKRAPPCLPESFNAKLQHLTFTNGADRGFVQKKYLSTFGEVMGSMDGLNFPRNNWGVEECKELAAILPWCKSIEYLDIGAALIGPEGTKHLATALPKCPSVRTLDLGMCKIGREGLVHLLAVLEQTNLLDLWLMDNDLDDDSVELLLDFVAGRRGRLRELSLRRNKVTDAGAVRLAAALREPRCQVRLLRLNENEGVTDASVEAMCTALLQSPCLETLDLRGTSIVAAGRQSVCAASEQRSGVKLLL